jgi:hypothetical protein
VDPEKFAFQLAVVEGSARDNVGEPAVLGLAGAGLFNQTGAGPTPRKLRADQKRLIRVWPTSAGDVVNGFVNETRRDCRDGVRRGAMKGTGD